MRLDKFISRGRIVELESTEIKDALDELLTASIARFKDLKKRDILASLLDRESTITTYLGNGVALPHTRVKMSRRYIIAVGRSQTGIQYDGLKEGETVRLIFLLIAGEEEPDYLQVLGAIARLVRDRDFVESLLNTPDTDAFYERLFTSFGGILGKPDQVQKNRVNRLIFRETLRLAKGANCTAILVFADTFTSGIEVGKLFPESRVILVMRGNNEALPEQKKTLTIHVRPFSRQRLAQLRSAVLVGLTRGIIQFTDRLCCLDGISGSNQFDTLVVVDVEREFQSLLADQANILPPDVKPEVLERVLAIATDLSVEGREGRPVGCFFVLGDSAKVEKMAKPLVLNPFYGYKDEDRNILNPFMDETIKEFSSLDGAFIIRGDGVIVAAGSLIHAPDYYHALPGGLGSRHAAAAAISIATDCISIAVSSSTGQVTLFRRGTMLPLLDKSSGGS